MTPVEVTALAGALASFAVDSAPGAGHCVYEEQPEAVVAAVARLGASQGATP